MNHLPIRPDIILDVKGLRCPEPIMLIRKTLRNMKMRQVLLILTDDLITIRDISNLCYFMGHKLVLCQKEKLPYRCLLCKLD